LIKLSPIDLFLGLSSLFDGSELDKGIVTFHFNSDELAIGLKEHSQVLSFCGLLVKVDYKECLRRQDALSTIIFLALYATIAAREFSSKCRGHVAYFPVEVFSVFRVERR